MSARQTALDLRLAALHIASLPEVQQVLDDYFFDLAPNVCAEDVYRALREAADRVEGKS